MELKFYKCNECGNVVIFAHNSGAPLICCGQKMQELKANTTDGAQEKHVPVYSIDGDQINIKIGSEPHPMEADHHIEFIVVETNNGYQFKSLKGWNEAVAKFRIPEDRSVKAIYEYCNKHGLWKVEIK